MSFSGLTNQIRRSGQRSSRQGARVDHLTLHHQAGTNDDAVINMMVNATRQVSANYTVSNEGRITGVVDEEDRAWTSGSSTDGGKGAAIDRRSITMEIENEAGAPNWPVSQIAHERVAALCADVAKRYGFDLNRSATVEGHRELWTRYRASYPTACPGGLNLDWIVTRARELLGQGSAPATIPGSGTGSTGATPTGYNFGGAAGVPAWKGLQTWLAREWGYSGIIDGIPGRMTWTALQKYLAKYWGYTGIIDGLPAKLSYGALQRWLKANYGYTGIVDGIPGPLTYAAMGRAGAALIGAAPASLPRTQIDGIPGKITWTRGQTWLKRDWGYKGVVDGIPGPLTYGALQRFLKAHWGYTGSIDGVPGRYTYSALQRWLKRDWGYTGPIDGIPGVNTWSAFQRFVNSI